MKKLFIALLGAALVMAVPAISYGSDSGPDDKTSFEVCLDLPDAPCVEVAANLIHAACETSFDAGPSVVVIHHYKVFYAMNTRQNTEILYKQEAGTITTWNGIRAPRDGLYRNSKFCDSAPTG